MQQTNDNRIVILPSEIDHDAYKMVLEAALKWPGQEIDLYCRGDGGYIRDAFAIIDVIRQHGNFTGLLAGMAYSSHADIWAACNKRYVYPLSAIGLHRVLIATSEQYKNAAYLQTKVQEGRRLDRMIAVLFAEASNADLNHWLDLFKNAADSVLWIHAAEIIHNYDLGVDVSERKQNSSGGVVPSAVRIAIHDHPEIYVGDGGDIVERIAGTEDANGGVVPADQMPDFGHYSPSTIPEGSQESADDFIMAMGAERARQEVATKLECAQVGILQGMKILIDPDMPEGYFGIEDDSGYRQVFPIKPIADTPENRQKAADELYKAASKKIRDGK